MDPTDPKELVRLFIELLGQQFGEGVAKRITAATTTDSADLKKYDEQLATNAPIKAKIAKAALAAIDIASPNCRGVLLDTGTVTACIAHRSLRRPIGPQLITPNITALRSAAYFKCYRRVKILGGNCYEERWNAAVDESTAREAGLWLSDSPDYQPCCDVAVVGIRAYDHQAGLGEAHPVLAGFQRALLENAKVLVLVAQGEKFMTAVEHPVTEHGKAFHDLLERRRLTGSAWFVFHPPSESWFHKQDIWNIKKPTPSQCREAMARIRVFSEMFPSDRVIDARSYRVANSDLLTGEILRARGEH